MARASLKRRVEQYQAANTEAAQIIIADPARYPGLMQEWAHRAYKRAFHDPDPWREGVSEDDRDDLADLMAWNRR